MRLGRTSRQSKKQSKQRLLSVTTLGLVLFVLGGWLPVQAASAKGFTLTATPSSLTIGPGARATSTIAVRRTGGFRSKISFSVRSGLSGTSVDLGAVKSKSTSVILSTDTTVPSQQGEIVIDAVGSGVRSSVTIAVLITGSDGAPPQPAPAPTTVVAVAPPTAAPASTVPAPTPKPGKTTPTTQVFTTTPATTPAPPVGPLDDIVVMEYTKPSPGKAPVRIVTYRNENGVLVKDGSPTREYDGILGWDANDVNKDGLTDLLILRLISTNLGPTHRFGVLYRQPDGTFREVLDEAFGAVYTRRPVCCSMFASGDLDGDGNIDIAYLASYEREEGDPGAPYRWILGYGRKNGTFELIQQDFVNTPILADTLAMVDLDRDGRSELVMYGRPRSGDGERVTRCSFPKRNEPKCMWLPISEFVYPIAADVNQDGFEELLLLSLSGTVYFADEWSKVSVSRSIGVAAKGIGTAGRLDRNPGTDLAVLSGGPGNLNVLGWNLNNTTPPTLAPIGPRIEGMPNSASILAGEFVR
jgi:hypothetical protein